MQLPLQTIFICNILCYNYTQSEVCRQKKYLKKNNPVLYAIDRSKAVGLVFVLILCCLVVYTMGASCLKSSRTLCPRVSSFFLEL